LFGTSHDNIAFEESAIRDVESLLPDDLYAILGDGKILMVMSKAAGKQMAVHEVAEHFGIALTNVIAFGDDHNDVDMLRECGIGVAVSNAITEAKAVADYICDSNENDGVARWLEANHVTTQLPTI
jgi:hydroxymethylpyrimidine pyrophosphatase-like HAD family hydrolase